MGKFIILLSFFCSFAFSVEQKTIVVTYSILGSLVKEVVGDKFNVEIVIPNGQDLHEWKPSAQDIKKIMKADLIVQNGLDVEEGLEKSINQASKAGIKIFTASNYVQVRIIKEVHEHNHGHVDGDPHFWLDPIAMKGVIIGLGETIKNNFGVDVNDRVVMVSKKLDDLNANIINQTQAIAPQNKKLITTHESLGYYAARYNFEVIGAVIPSFTTGAKASAAQIAKLEKLIQKNKVPAIFAEIGAPKQTLNAIAKDTGVKVVELNDHILPKNGSYYDMMNDMTVQIVRALK